MHSISRQVSEIGPPTSIGVIECRIERIPKAKTMKPEEFMDSSFVKKLDDEKFYDWLYKR